MGVPIACIQMEGAMSCTASPELKTLLAAQEVVYWAWKPQGRLALAARVCELLAHPASALAPEQE